METGLLDRVLQGDEGRLIVLKRHLQGKGGLFDLLVVLARWPLALGGTNEARGKDGVGSTQTPACGSPMPA